MTEQPASEKSIFLAALDKGSPAERAAYLDEVCGDNRPLRAEVEALLAAHERLDPLPPAPATTAAEPRLTEAAGTRIGPYKLLEPIGEGGMGTVWMAEQQEPVRRLVALKVIKAGLDSAQIVARFEAERQALALMDHPNIAKVLDAGTTDSPLAPVLGGEGVGVRGYGRPYFVMELVKGVPITKYCDEHRLTPRQRLELFVPVCQAVQHAHQKGIIHRDIKPSNVLVASYDGVPVPKVIDFGVAKATCQKLTGRTLVTGFGHLVGTLEYMSPEQAEFNALDIDTRSDIYALGVLLYELLTGTTPLTKQRLKEAALAEVLRAIREEEPPKPSTRLSASKDSLASVSAQRQMEPAQLTRQVRGELDWIVMKALEKDRGRRYETANGFAQDVERYLRDEPVQAGPPSVSYRFRKFARRNKGMMRAAAVVAVAVLFSLTALAVSTVLTARANQDLQHALNRERDILERERQNAYFQRIALAEREWSANNLGRYEWLLNGCPADLRGWEWHYLKRLRYKTVPSLRHEGAALCAAVSPDSTRVASSSQNGWVKVWDAQTGQQILAFQAHTHHAYCVAFSPDGGRLATGSWDGTVKLWDAQTGDQLPGTKRHEAQVWRVAFSPDGRYLASAGNLSDVKVWNVATGDELISLRSRNRPVYGLAFSPDGKRLVTAGSKAIAEVWDAHTGQELLTFQGHSRTIWCVAFSPDGGHVASGGAGLKVWNSQTGQEVRTLAGHANTIYGVAFSPDGRRLASASRDETVKLWDLASGQEALTLRGHRNGVHSVAFSTDGHRLVSASFDRFAHVWDASPMTDAPATGCLTLRGHGKAVHGVAFHPTDPRVVASAGADGTVRLWDAWSGKQLRTLDGPSRSQHSVAFSANGLLVAAAGMEKSLKLWDATTGQEVHTLQGHTGDLLSVAFSPDGRWIAAAGYDRVVRIWEVSSGRQFAELRAHNWVIFGVAFSPDSRYIASASLEGTLRVWDMTTRKEAVSPSLAHADGVSCVAFSRDGRRLVSGGLDRTVRVWDTRDWKRLHVLRDPSGGVTSVAFSPDGRRVAWGSKDATVKLWDEASEEIHTLRGHLNRVEGVAFSPDGKQIASASADGTVNLWDVPRGLGRSDSQVGHADP